MKINSLTATDQRQPALAEGIFRRLRQITVVFTFQAVVLFLAAGRMEWPWAWVFLLICIVSVSINAIIMLRTSPQTIAERGAARETKGWDKIVGGLWSVSVFLAVPLVAGLDARSGWTQGLSAACNIASAVALASGLGFAGWAMISNAFFSTAVRIQRDRGQTVCRSGPYRYVRHPGYAGFILQSLATPFLLGSVWALIPGLVAAALMVARTSFEDRMLQNELDGYLEFALEVRYRLIPGCW